MSYCGSASAPAPAASSSEATQHLELSADSAKQDFSSIVPVETSVATVTVMESAVPASAISALETGVVEQVGSKLKFYKRKKRIVCKERENPIHPLL
jgi:hypothetical protein